MMIKIFTVVYLEYPINSDTMMLKIFTWSKYLLWSSIPSTAILWCSKYLQESISSHQRLKLWSKYLLWSFCSSTDAQNIINQYALIPRPPHIISTYWFPLEFFLYPPTPCDQPCSMLMLLCHSLKISRLFSACCLSCPSAPSPLHSPPLTLVIHCPLNHHHYPNQCCVSPLIVSLSWISAASHCTTTSLLLFSRLLWLVVVWPCYGWRWRLMSVEDGGGR